MKNIEIFKTGVGRQSNPTPVLDGQRVESTYDDVGRAIVVPYQVRDLVQTAYASVSSGTPVTLISGDSGFFHDLMEISFASNSTVAVTSVTLKDDGTTVRIVDIPPDDTVQLTFPVPLNQGAKGGNWQVDMDDVTGVTIDIGATYIRNV